ncbi:putative phage abortive infection protein [Delftia tsuruhatensis]|uniref:putative phage abortive infection protein n=1 Tax=Delftia tsuruhatensis TaxID=180282 RepID=UPI0019112516|nr:putative phage abortive infection protein [Delftia tsuruhatensis]
MTKPKDQNSGSTPGLPRRFWALIVVCVLYTATVTFLIYRTFEQVLPEKDMSKWGQVGDYFGGMLNPFFGLITVILVIYSIHVQRIEFRQSTNALNISNTSTIKSSFESSLFAWLGNYRDLVQQIAIDGNHGRSAINHLVETKLSTLSLMKRSHSGSTAELAAVIEVHYLERVIDNYDNISLEESQYYDDKLKEAARIYDKLYIENRAQLDAPIRTLYRLYKWIDASQNISTDEKWHYSSLIRAQLSWPELIIIFYNCQTKNGERFAGLVNKYALLDNLDDNGEALIKHRKHRIRSEGTSSALKRTAFSSKEAKTALGIAEDL